MQPTPAGDTSARPATDAYEAPAVVDYGDLVTLTGASVSGSTSDADFPSHTARGALTFS